MLYNRQLRLVFLLLICGVELASGDPRSHPATSDAPKEKELRPRSPRDDAPTGFTETPNGLIGPDLIVSSIQSFDSGGSEFDPETNEGIAAFGAGTTVCNIGDTPALYYENTPAHPVISQGMFRLLNGRFEQIGMSWVEHEFFAVNQGACGVCQNPFSPGPNQGYLFGVNCSNPQAASINGSTGGKGPRSQINAYTGTFRYPPRTPAMVGDKIERRLQVHHDDLDPLLNPGALYFAEGRYDSADDAQSGNAANNASYRRLILVDPDLNPGACPRHRPNATPPQIPNTVYFCLTTSTFSTQRQQAAIRAWKDHDPEVLETEILTPEDPSSLIPGVMILAAKATELSAGVWHYEYALQNINSDRAAGSFSIPVPTGATIENIGFHDVSYHSGNDTIENYEDIDWEVTLADTSLTWATTPYSQKQNANALRWGTLYNFRFDINVRPVPIVAVVGLFKPSDGLPNFATANTIGPVGNPIHCDDDADCNDGDPCSVDFCDGELCHIDELSDCCRVDADCEAADACSVAKCIANRCELLTGIGGPCDDGVCGNGLERCELCPELDRCCFPPLNCISTFAREACLRWGGTPDCVDRRCFPGDPVECDEDSP